MVTFTAEYLGELRCRAVHGPSGTEMITDAPADNGGKASSFSPTDLVATGLLTCIFTTLAIMAQRNQLELKGMSGKIEKVMRATPPRRIEALKIQIKMPIAEDHPLAEGLKSAAHSCPVHLSLLPDIQESIEWEWA